MPKKHLLDWLNTLLIEINKMKYFFSFFVLIILISCSGSEEEENGVEIETTINEVVEDTTTTVAPDTLTKSGETVEYHPNGAVKMRGKLNDNGMRHGLWISFYDNGIKWSEAYYIDGVLDGHSITFFPNGKVRYIGEYKNGDKTGTWKFYDEAGELVKEENY